MPLVTPTVCFIGCQYRRSATLSDDTAECWGKREVMSRRGRIALHSAMLLTGCVVASAEADAQEQLPTVEVVGVSPVAGSEIDRDKVPSNVQTHRAFGLRSCEIAGPAYFDLPVGARRFPERSVRQPVPTQSRLPRLYSLSGAGDTAEHRRVSERHPHQRSVSATSSTGISSRKWRSPA